MEDPSKLAHIDPRLIEQLDAAADDEEVEGVFAVKALEGEEAATASESLGGEDAGTLLIRKIAKDTGIEPTHIRSFPRLHVIHVKGRKSLLSGLIHAEQVRSASAVDPEDFYLPTEEAEPDGSKG